jgi:ribosomal protein L4
VRRKALAGILSERLSEGNLRLIRDASSTGRTREMAEMLRSQGCEGRRTVVLVGDGDGLMIRAIRNIPYAVAVSARSVSLTTLVDSEVVLITESAVDLLKERVS